MVPTSKITLGSEFLQLGEDSLSAMELEALVAKGGVFLQAAHQLWHLVLHDMSKTMPTARQLTEAQRERFMEMLGIGGDVAKAELWIDSLRRCVRKTWM